MAAFRGGNSSSSSSSNRGAAQPRAFSIDDFPIVQRIPGLSRRSAVQAYAPCPAHPTSHDSLSIGLTDKGHLGLHCFAGCSVADILAALQPRGLWSELFPQTANQHQQSHSSQANTKKRGRVVSAYSYQDATGQELFQVVRYEPKDFRQRHRSADGTKWINQSVDPSKRVLYRLPLILAAPTDQPIFLVEGEKDADRLILSCRDQLNRPIIATTAPGGSSSAKSKLKWLPQYTESLRGRTVIIIPDSDVPGREHAINVARELSGQAAHVSILQLPVLLKLESPSLKKWDISDWLDAGGTQQQFFQAVAESLNTQFDPTAAENQPALPTICNADDDGTGTLTPLNISEIIRRIRSMTDDWPRRVGSALFFHNQIANEIHWMTRSSQLFAFLGSRLKCCMDFHKLPGCPSKDEVFSGLQQLSTSYRAVEMLPHEPPLQDHFYACDSPESGNGDALFGLADRFCPATEIDCHLIICLFATIFWGGPPGSRPAFVITSDKGRGVGKSKMATMVGYLANGTIDIHSNEDSTKMKERLLSPAALSRRVALLDNVKTHRFSWAELESIITSPAISGRQMYVGEARRPNTLTWIITLNGIALSTDMAQRTVTIKVDRPRHSGDWEEQTHRYIDENRQAIIADLVGFLRRPKKDLIRYTRWGTWERQVLSILDDPDAVQDEIINRQSISDVEEEETQIIVEYFSKMLADLQYDPQKDIVFIPSEVAAEWHDAATKEKHKPAASSRMLRQRIGDSSFRGMIDNDDKNGRGRGFIWIGHNSKSSLPKTLSGWIDARMDITDRIEERNHPRKYF